MPNSVLILLPSSGTFSGVDGVPALDGSAEAFTDAGGVASGASVREADVEAMVVAPRAASSEGFKRRSSSVVSRRSREVSGGGKRPTAERDQEVGWGRRDEGGK